MSAPAREIAESLRDATRALQEALATDDDAAVASALERRETALARLAELLPLDPTLEPLLREVQRLETETLAEAERRLAGVRDELEQIGRARRVARSLVGEHRSARFVSERA